MSNNGATVSFGSARCKIKKSERLMATSFVRENFYHLNNCKEQIITHQAIVGDLSLWHARLAHATLNEIRKLASGKDVAGLQLHSTAAADYTCEPCVYGGQTRGPTLKSGGATFTYMLNLVHSNLGTIPVGSLGRLKYFVSFIDHQYCYC